ncbi:MAG: NAD-dependent epimerase/dehydratase family protein [Frankia sp.]|nr:NAD-dependent epimerase/dehydratase family protein [Frankia sp.]
MKVLVTGGTGYVGSHTVAALVAAGHAPRLLARDPARVEPALAPLGVDRSAVEVVPGDATDPDGLGEALTGCDAVIHAAAVYSLDSRDVGRIAAVNVRAADIVLNAAVAAGADPVVHVSSTAALLPCADEVMSERSAVGTSPTPYMRSKAEAERIARGLQEKGAPVVITYPAAVWGPHDPHLGDQLARLRRILRGQMPVMPAGGFVISDVRDVAQLHARVLGKGRGPRCYVAPAASTTTRELIGVIRQVTGRRLPTVFPPVAVVRPLTRPVDAVQRVCPWRLPVEYEGVCFLAWHPPVDDRLARTELGLAGRSLTETVRDSIGWLYANGFITARQAGHSATTAGST